MNIVSVAAFVAFLISSSLGLASSLVHLEGTSSTCVEACSDARTFSLGQMQKLCDGGIAVEKSSRSKCVDGGDYDVKCHLTLEVQCSAKLEAMDWQIGPFKSSSRIVTGVCGEISPTLGDRCVLWSVSTEEQNPVLSGYVIDQEDFSSVIPEGVRGVIGKTLKVRTSSLEVVVDRSSEDALLGKVLQLVTVNAVIDPRTAQAGYENKIGKIAHAVCGEVNPRLGDQCVMLVRESTGAFRVIIADQDLVQDEFSRVSGLSGKWIHLDVIFKPVSLKDAKAAKRLLVNKYFVSEEWTIGN